MKEYKFRGKRKDNGEWVYGSLVKTFIMTSIVFETYEGYFHELEVQPETIGQFTGLKDNTGKEIYEGDIVFGIIIGNSIPTMGEIVYDANYQMYSSKNLAGITPLYKIRNYDVKGNKYENPELLEASNCI